MILALCALGLLVTIAVIGWLKWISLRDCVHGVPLNKRCPQCIDDAREW